MTRNLMHRARGKWSPSGDTGEAAGCRTDPAVSCPERRVGRACAAHKGAELADASASSAGMETGRVVATPSAVSPRRALRMSNGHALPGNRRSTPSSPAFAERPESRAKTAERGAGRCHLTLFTRGSFRRPVRMLFETPRAKPSRGLSCWPVFSRPRSGAARPAVRRPGGRSRHRSKALPAARRLPPAGDRLPPHRAPSSRE